MKQLARLTLWVMGLTLLTACPSTPPGINVSISPSGTISITLLGDSRQLTATVTGTANQAVTWTSSSTSVTVDDTGLVTPIAPATATITARSVADTSKFASVQVNVNPGTNNLSISGTADILQPQAAAITGEFINGEVIVKFKPSVSLQSVQSLSVGTVTLSRVQDLSLENTFLYRASLDRLGTIGAIQALSQRSDVEYAEPNYLYRHTLTPNDPLYSQQWDLPAINMPTAWDVTTGSSSVNIAVIDTGILSGHPDLAGKIVPGFDFISTPSIANDGDGRDPNPEDVGDNPGGQSSYHGSHVAGTAAAASNNGVGIAGVSFGSKILPVRVLGVGGGSNADIIDAMRWAAGLAVTGVPNNTNPARVLNLSLGGTSACSLAMQSAINDVLATGSVIVVAAGNSNVNAQNSSPANCNGVITVGATNRAGNRASYSNFGSTIEVMAPGGETNTNNTDGILSTLKDDTTGQFNYVFYQGTSMATPHVAGVVALMKSLKPSLTPAEALSALQSTAVPLSAAQCNRPSASDCGAGLINVRAALDAVAGSPTPTPSLTLTANPSSLTITAGNNANVALSLIRSNFTGSVTFSHNAPGAVTVNISPSPTTGNTATLTLNSSTPGDYSFTVQASGTVSAQTTINLKVVASPPTPTVTLKNTKIFPCIFVISGQNIICSYFTNTTALITEDVTTKPYTLSNLYPGKYGVLAFKDTNNNGQIDVDEYFTIYTNNGNIIVQPPATGINLLLEPPSGTTFNLRGKTVLLKNLRVVPAK